MVLVLVSGSHDEELGEDTVEASEAGEVVGIGAARVVPGLMHGAEEGLAAMGGAGVCGGEEGLGCGMRDRGDGLRVRGAVAAVGAGVGAEESDDEDAGEDFDGAAGFVEATHFAGRCGGVRRWRLERRVGRGRHGSFRLGTASHGWVTGGAGFFEIQGSLQCAALRSR
jgi:hypothetical protein